MLRGATRRQRPALLSQESFREIQALLDLAQFVTDLLKLSGQSSDFFPFQGTLANPLDKSFP